MMGSVKSKLSAIEKKIDAINDHLTIQGRMLKSIIEIIDDRQHLAGRQKMALNQYIDNVTGIMQAGGAPESFVQSFRDLLNFNEGEKNNASDS